MVVGILVRKLAPFRPRSDYEPRDGQFFVTSVINDADMLADWVYFYCITTRGQTDFYEFPVFDIMIKFKNIQYIQIGSCLLGTLAWAIIASDGRIVEFLIKFLKMAILGSVKMLHFVIIFSLIAAGYVTESLWCKVLATKINGVSVLVDKRFIGLKNTIEYRSYRGFYLSHSIVILLGALLEDLPQIAITCIIDDLIPDTHKISETARINIIMALFGLLNKFGEAYDLWGIKVHIGEGERMGLLRTFRDHTVRSNSGIKAIGARTFLSLSKDGTAKIWNISIDAAPVMKCRAILRKKTYAIYDVAVVPDNGVLLAAKSGVMQVLDTETGAVRVSTVVEEGIRSITVSPDGRTFLAVWGNDTIFAMELPSFELVMGFVREEIFVQKIIFLDNSHFVGAYSDGNFLLFNIKNKRPIKRYTGHIDEITALIEIDSDSFLSGSKDTTIKRWDVKTGACLRLYEGHRKVITDIVTISCNRFISGSEDGTARIWDVDQSGCVMIYSSIVGRVRAVEMMDEGNSFLLSDDSKRISLWAVTGESTRRRPRFSMIRTSQESGSLLSYLSKSDQSKGGSIVSGDNSSTVSETNRAVTDGRSANEGRRIHIRAGTEAAILEDEEFSPQEKKEAENDMLTPLIDLPYVSRDFA